MTLLGVTVVVGLLLAGVVVADALDVDRRRRALPRWLGLSIVGVAFMPVLALEGGLVPWTGDLALVGAVLTALTLYIGVPFVVAPVFGATEATTDEPDLVGTHVRPQSDAYHAGIYRVVGASGLVVLLRVTDETGRRRHTGSVIDVDADTLETAFAPATDPDAGLHPLRTLHTEVTGVAWRVRELVGGFLK
ncbi:MAG: hypothetical protein ABEJ57_00780 [Halobacteriaceae archaeon]